MADLADGRLGPAEAERAFAHVASCDACAAELSAQRATHARLACDERLDAPDDLLQRLRGIPAAGFASPAVVPAQGSAGVRPTGGAGAHPGSRSAASAGPSRRAVRGRVALASAAGAATLAVLAVVGAGSTSLTGSVVPRPAIAPVIDTFAVEHAVSVDQMPFSGPRIALVGFAGPASPASPSPQP